MNFLPTWVVRFVRFGLSGLPGFVVGIGVNVLAIELLRWPKSAAYLLVMWIQMTLGYLMCRAFVFEDAQDLSFLRGYWQFAASMAAIRVADWLFYTGLVDLAKVPYVLAQICSSVTFLLIKFVSARAIFKASSHSA